MKNFELFTCLSFILALTSCYRDSEDEISVNDKYVTFNFNLAGVEKSSLTRAISEPSNLLIIDKFGDEVTSDTKTSLAPFSLPLDYGRHEIYFVAADKIWTSYSTAEWKVEWPSSHDGLSYVWAAHLTLDVDEDTSVEDIMLPLIIANVQVKTLDKVPATASSLHIDAPDLCKGLDLLTLSGIPTDTPVNYSLDLSRGTGNTLRINLFTFVPPTSCIGDISLTVLDQNTQEIAAKTLNEVPVQPGYISLYAGYLFSDGISFPLSYTDDWSGTHSYGF